MVGEVKDIDWFDPSGEKILPNRQDISVTRMEETSTLVIYKANMDNAGIYTCVAKDGEKEAQATVRVTIYRRCRQHCLHISLGGGLVIYYYSFILVLLSQQ